MDCKKIICALILAAVILVGSASAASTITGATVSDNNIYGTSSVNGIAPSVEDTSTGTSSTSNLYITASGLTAVYNSGTGVATYTVTGQKGAGVRSSNNLVTGGMDWQYYYPSSSASETNFALTKELTESGTFSSKLTLSNDLNTTGITVSLSSPIVAVTGPSITAVSVNPTSAGVATQITASATATGTGTLTYQWYQSSDAGSTWNAIAGATSASSSFTLPAGTYLFKVVVTDSAGESDSYSSFSSVSATVYAAPVISVVSASPTSGALSNTVTLTVSATGTGTLTYQWYEGANPISGATTATYLVNVNDATGTTHTYHAVVTDQFNQTATSDNVTYQSFTGPSISSVSASPTTGPLSNTVTLTVSATGTGNLTYQWYEGANPISGATTATYQATISDSATTLHTYHAVVTDQYSQTATSGNVTYQSYAGPSISSVSASPTTGPLSNTVTLTVSATGTGTLTYQWYEGANPISGATTATYQVNVNDATGTTHTYHAVVTDQFNQTATSGNVTYQSYAAPVITNVTASPTEGPLNESVTLSANVTGATSYQWYENGTVIAGATTATYQATISDGAATVHTYTLRATGIGGTTESTAVTYQSYAAPVFSSIDVSPTLGPNPLTITATATASDTTTYTWHTSTDQSTWSQIGTGSSINYTYSEIGTNYVKCIATGIGGTTESATKQVQVIDGVVTITNVSVSPSIGPIGTTYNLSVTASAVQGASITGYQWYVSTDATTWTPIAATQNATYTPAEAGSYYYKVVISDSLSLTTDSYAGGFTSAKGDAVQVTSASAGIDITEGPLQNTITATATGTVIPAGTALTYQWYENGTVIAGATAATYQATISDGAATVHTYKVVISSNGSSLESNTVTYQSYPAPVITNVTASPTEGPLYAGVTLSADVTGATSYQWYEGANPISGATTATYLVNVNDAVSTTHTYTLRATGIGGTTESTAVTYQSYRTPVVTATISAASGVLNSSPVLSASSVDPNVTYQWQELIGGNWIDMPGATSATFGVNLSDAVSTTHTYHVLATNAGGIGTSNNVTYLTYTAPTAVISANRTVIPIPGTAVLTATTTSAVSVQWQQSNDGMTFNNVPGAMSDTYTPTFTTAGTFYYRLQATGYTSAVIYSNIVSIVTGTAPTVTITSPTNGQEISSGEITLKANATNASSILWSLPGSSSNGGLTTANSWVRYTQDNTYTITVTATNQFGSATDSVTILYGNYLRMKASQTFDNQSDAKFQTIIGAVGDFNGDIDSAVDIVEESATPFTDVLGTALFYLLIFGIPAILIWFASGSAKIPAIIGVVFSVFIMIFIPDAWGATIGILIAVVIATGVLWLVAHRE